MDELINSINSGKGDYASAGRNVYLIDLDTGEKLGLMGLPKELDYQPLTKFATISPYGRNTASYHYTGAEDKLEFEVSYWAEAFDKTDVIERCKWVESLSKSDGGIGRPHIVRFMWGQMFSKATWLVLEAPYRMMDFDATQGMRPIHAFQRITLARYNPKNTRIQEIVDWRY